ncbi:MAG: PDZ domain-containing protein [Clostridia bacterium]|nr:PDZ domain-containing protein [Clostridia bacterium]
MTIEEMIVSAKNGETVVLPDETIRITRPIELKGKKDISIVGGKNTVLTGSIVLNGEWADYDGNIRILKTEKGLDIQQIYVNGKKYIMARYPNEDPTKWLDGHSEDAVSAERIASWKDPKGGYIRALHCAEWGGNSYIINGKNEDGTLDLKWIGDNNRGRDYHKNVVMVENIFEELDSEKEWFYDKENGLLYIIPENGTDLSGAVIEAAVNGEIFKITDCENVSISGITFKNTKRLLFCSEYELITRSDWGIARNGAIYINNCENVKISDCNFNEVGGNCVFIDGKNEYISVENCDLTDCGASGVCIFGDQKCVRDLSTWSDHRTVISDLERGPQSDEYPRNIKVKDCYFYNLGIYEKQTSPVTMSVSSKVTVEGCTIHHVPRAGLNVCDGSFGGHRFINNLVFDTVRETGDHGPFNSWGRDRFWSLDGFDTGGNNGTNKRKVSTLDAIETTVIAHNMFVGNRGFGIDLDDGSTNYMITKNYCVGVGIKLREGFLRTVRNNFIVNAPLDVHCTFANCDDVIENNIVVTERPLSLYAINDGFTTRAANNLFVGADKEVLTNSFLKDNVNYVCDKNDRAALAMAPAQIYFEPIVMEFGRKDKPKPVIENLAVAAVETVKALDATFMPIDESVRSMAGLPDYDGATVTEISESSPLYILGARKDDVIISVNDEKIKTPADMVNVAEIKNVKLIRAQKEIIL